MVSFEEANADRADARLVEDTTAAHVCYDVPRTVADATVGEVRAALTARRYESVADVAVCDDNRLVGLVPVEAMLAAPGDQQTGAVMDRDPPVVAPGTDKEVAAWKAVEHGETSLTVVDASGRFVGLVPPRRLLRVLLAEHDEDLARLSGVLRSTSAARRAARSPSDVASATGCPGWFSASSERSTPTSRGPCSPRLGTQSPA